VRIGRIAGILIAVLALAAPAASARGPVEAHVLAVNDFHGQLEALDAARTSNGRVGTTPAGGAEYLASHIRRMERRNKHSLVVAAGDVIGASPLLSALFHDEPTIEAMNRIGLDITSVGNHEFDEGERELRRMQSGGCHPVDGCRDGNGFRGARFGFLAANVVRRGTGRPLFDAYAIRRLGGVRVGFIGMTLEGTPGLVTPTGIQRLRFLDEADTANRYARQLRRRGVEAIVVLLHEGGFENPMTPKVNDCSGFDGPVRDIVNRTSQAVDAFITGHTHQAYNCVIDGRPVTSAFSLGRVVTDLELHLSRRTGDVTRVSANNVTVTRDVDPAKDVTRLIDRYSALAAPYANRVIGRTSAPITRQADADGESAAGLLIADSQHAATSAAATGGAVAAFMNPGGVRADFPAGDVTYGDAFTVQPFGNNLTTITLTGAQVWRMLGQQWCGQTSGARILQPSASVRSTWSAARVSAACATNPVTALSIAGSPVPDDVSRSYRITVNSFLADGGDGFTVLRDGRDRLGGPVDVDALESYLEPSLTGTPVAPPARDRITAAP
jgi:5'-nucleotidase